MVDKIAKFLKKLTQKDLDIVRECIDHVLVRKFDGYNVRKLKDRDDLYRIKRGRVRIIYKDNGVGEIKILKISFRDESTYKGL